MADLVIHNGSLVYPDGVVTASIAVADGRIEAIGAAHAMPDAAEAIDAIGLHILPGAIDVHVHFRDPGYTHRAHVQVQPVAVAVAVAPRGRRVADLQGRQLPRPHVSVPFLVPMPITGSTTHNGTVPK